MEYEFIYENKEYRYSGCWVFEKGTFGQWHRVCPVTYRLAELIHGMSETTRTEVLQGLVFASSYRGVEE